MAGAWAGADRESSECQVGAAHRMRDQKESRTGGPAATASLPLLRRHRPRPALHQLLHQGGKNAIVRAATRASSEPGVLPPEDESAERFPGQLFSLRSLSNSATFPESDRKLHLQGNLPEISGRYSATGAHETPSASPDHCHRPTPPTTFQPPRITLWQSQGILEHPHQPAMAHRLPPEGRQRRRRPNHRLSLSHRHEKETATHPAAQLLRRNPPRNA